MQKADLPILCHRHTTSKLKEFSDLSSIATYGFRGEALASITHISQLSVTTRTAQSDCAYKAVYIDSELAPMQQAGGVNPRPIAGRIGTVIAVENMFYNMPTRRRAFDKPNEEYARILDVVNKYAIHHAGVAFSCKRQGESAAGLSTLSKNSTLDNIRVVHGSAVANELMSFDLTDDALHFKASGWVSNVNWNARKLTFILFVNHRLVDSNAIRKGIEHLYGAFLPKGTHPFVLLSLEIDPARIDVNVHPTKHEVHILDETEVISAIVADLAERLGQANESRAYQVQSILVPPTLDAGLTPEKIRRSQVTVTPSVLGDASTPARFVRTDSKQQKLTSIFEPLVPKQASTTVPTATAIDAPREKLVDRDRQSIRLTSVKELRADVRKDIHEDMTAIFSELVWVGVVDYHERLAMIQHLTKLYLVDYGAVAFELFYQIGLSEFGNFGAISLTPPISIRELLELDYDEDSVDDAEVERIAQQLIGVSKMLMEYFSLGISAEGRLTQIPLLLRSYVPSLELLPSFLHRLGTNVDWSSEKACFDGFLRELAAFYVPESYKSKNLEDYLARAAAADNPNTFDPNDETAVLPDHPQPAPPSPPTAAASGLTLGSGQINADPNYISPGFIDQDDHERELERLLETVLFPAIKKRLIATRKLATERRVIEVANLPDLYKIFERC